MKSKNKSLPTVSELSQGAIASPRKALILGVDLGSEIVVATPEGDYIILTRTLAGPIGPTFNIKDLSNFLAQLGSPEVCTAAIEIPVGAQSHHLAVVQGAIASMFAQLRVTSGREISASAARAAMGVPQPRSQSHLQRKYAVVCAVRDALESTTGMAAMLSEFEVWLSESDNKMRPQFPAKFKRLSDVADAVLLSRYWLAVCTEAAKDENNLIAA
jgi:hypothetical protein